MLRSMNSAISGLKNHQTMMDVISNNIANVNTTGFKSSRCSPRPSAVRSPGPSAPVDRTASRSGSAWPSPVWTSSTPRVS